MKISFPAEWYPQSGVQLTWPHKDTDWADYLEEVIACYVSIAKEILRFQKLIIVCKNKEEVLLQIKDKLPISNISFYEMDTNDTWARDHTPISVFIDGVPTIYDFTFNAWGLKFAADKDNLISRNLYLQGAFNSNVKYMPYLEYVLEGGAIESDGCGTLLTTEKCLLSNNRNEFLSKEEQEELYKKIFGLERILWLKHGFLKGDDTDSHVDTLARFCAEDTIAYVQCVDKEDEHYEELYKMEQELKSFKTKKGEPYCLIPLPLPPAIYDDLGNRLPATYANFLIINKAVLLPIYACEEDKLAAEQLKKAFPDRELVCVNCLPLIKQHGSLHCVSMQYPQGFLQ